MREQTWFANYARVRQGDGDGYEDQRELGSKIGATMTRHERGLCKMIGMGREGDSQGILTTCRGEQGDETRRFVGFDKKMPLRVDRSSWVHETKCSQDATRGACRVRRLSGSVARQAEHSD